MGTIGKTPASLVATDVWSAASRTLSAFDAAALFDVGEIDSAYPAAALTSSGTADTFGAWVELIADVGASKRLIGIIVAFTDTNASSWEIEIGEGAGAAEAAITRVSGTYVFSSAVGFQPGVFYPLWRSLTDNARLSARVKDTEAAGRGFRVTAVVA